MTEPAPAGRPHRRSLLKPALIAGAVTLAFAFGAVAATAAPEAVAAMHPGGHGGHGGKGMHAMGAMHLEKLLAEAGATAEQKAKITANMKRAHAAMEPLHARMGDTHRSVHELLAAPSIDRAALERLRAQRIADVDQASKVMVSALADSAEALTPEQRAKVAAAMAAHHREH